MTVKVNTILISVLKVGDVCDSKASAQIAEMMNMVVNDKVPDDSDYVMFFGIVSVIFYNYRYCIYHDMEFKQFFQMQI